MVEGVVEEVGEEEVVDQEGEMPWMWTEEGEYPMLEGREGR